MQFHSEADEAVYITRIWQVADRIQRDYIVESVPFEVTVATTDERVPFGRRLEAERRPIAEGERWGSEWQTGWFHLKGTVPAEWAGSWVVAWLEIEGEGLIYDTSGLALQGITNGSVFDQQASRSLLDLFQQAKGGEAVELWLEGAVPSPELPGCWGHQSTVRNDDPARFGRLNASVQRLRLARVNRDHWDLRWDFDVIRSLIREGALPKTSVRRARLVKAISEALDLLAREPQNYRAARACLAAELAKPANASDIRVQAVGHAHIDTAWLWPMAESKRKVARTFASQLALIEKYPGYIFGASTPQHYVWLKESHPDLFAKVKAAVAAGTWELQGGMWVEADCNLPDGESLVRQFLHGKNFFRDEFGADVDNLWIPDVFGYAASLPQIMALSGCTTFLTQKISWSQYNVFPYNTFWWQGIDGSRVLTHFPPENNYNGNLNPADLMAAQERFKEKAFAPAMMSLFGIGDGGGGPREDMLERGLRMHDVEGSPPVRFGTARDFFAELRGVSDQFQTWVGELYLELHRGTLTSQALIKKNNRRLEQRLNCLEKLFSLRLADYPAAALDAIWKEVLTLQFHDIIPGSSINIVNRETHAAHERLLAACDTLLAEFSENLPAAAGHTVFNSLSLPWHGAVVLPAEFAGRVAMAGGKSLPTQVEADGSTVALVTIPAHGSLTLTPGSEPAAACTAGDGRTLDNGLVRYVFDAQGRLLEALDRAVGRNLLRAPGNVLSLYHDRPNYWDAWDVDRFYRDAKIADAVCTVEDLGGGPVRRRLRLSTRIGDSDLTQTVVLTAGSRRLDFETHVAWREGHRMLRVAFPAAVQTERAAAEIQYGHVFRPTHTNTSWDMAKFEVAAQRWVDVSEPTAGLALLNDCKYGHRLLDNVLDLNLLRAPMHPDPDADLGEHTFTYSLLPHAGDLIASDVPAEARRLNQPPLALPGRALPGPLAAGVTGEGVELTVIKRAEKSDALVIRLVETLGRRCTTTVTLATPGRLVACDLLEWHDGEPTAAADEHLLEFTPFQIRTFKLLA